MAQPQAIEGAGIENNPKRNDKMLAFLHWIDEEHKNRPFTDGSKTLDLIREARDGAMYDHGSGN